MQPMPHPFACPYGCPTPDAFVPALYACGAGCQTGSEYSIELKGVEVRSGEDNKEYRCPKVTVADGQHAAVCLDGGLIGGTCQVKTACLVNTTSRRIGPGCVVEVEVMRVTPSRVRLSVVVQQNEVEQSDKTGTLILGRSLSAIRYLKAGKTSKVVLERAADGTACRWLEVVVNEQKPCAADAVPTPAPTACCPMPLPPPPPCCVGTPVACCPPCPSCPSCTPCTLPCSTACSECPMCVLARSKPCQWLCSVVMHVAERLGLCQTWAGGMTLPAPRYLMHPPQYVPPSPAFPLSRELASQEACEKLPAPTPIEPCASVTKSVVPETKVSAVTCQDGKTHLEITTGESCMSCKKMSLQTTHDPLRMSVKDGQVHVAGNGLSGKADCVCTDGKDQVTLEGHVVLRCHLPETKTGLEHCGITMGEGCVIVNLATGEVQVKPSTTLED
jgi:hypothetical protein